MTQAQEQSYRSFFRIYLSEELSRRRAQNPRYSMRAFASSLGLNAGNFSRILNGKLGISMPSAEKVVESLKIPEREADYFLASVAEELKVKHRARSKRLTPYDVRPPAETLSNDAFEVIGDLCHTAILELTYVDGFDPSPKWIGKALGITTIEAEHAVARLLRLGLLKREAGTLVKVQKVLKTNGKETTSHLRRHFREVLKRSTESLTNDPITRRCFSGTTLPIDPAKIETARSMIEEFQRQLADFLIAGERKEVYQLAISLFPLQSHR